MSEEVTLTSKMATSVVMDVFGYTLCRLTLKALVGLLLLLMSVAGKRRICCGLQPFFSTPPMLKEYMKK